MVLLDVSLPDMNGIDLIHDIKKLLPEIRILMISMHTKIEYLTSAFQAGARGYVVKDAPSGKILQALDLVSQGEYFLDTSVARQVVERLAELPGRQAKFADAAYGSLTPREQEILRLWLKQSRKKLPPLHQPQDGGKPGQHRPNSICTHPGNGAVCCQMGLIDVDHYKLKPPWA
jgi:DNA-binding response OmpR family regulator